MEVIWNYPRVTLIVKWLYYGGDHKAILFGAWGVFSYFEFNRCNKTTLQPGIKEGYLYFDNMV